MQAYILRRLLALIPTLFFASVIVFTTVRLIPGDVIDLMLSQNDISASKMDREALMEVLGLDKPEWEEYSNSGGWSLRGSGEGRGREGECCGRGLVPGGGRRVQRRPQRP